MDDTMYGLLYVLFTFGIPIVVITIIVRSKKKKEEAAKKAAEQQARRKQEEAQEAAREVARKAEELKRHGASVTSDALVEKYRANPKTTQAAEKFAEAFIKGIKGVNRDVRNTTIKYDLEMGAVIGKGEGATCTKIGHVSATRSTYVSLYGSNYDYSFCYHNGYYSFGDLINFVSENLKPLQGRNEMLAFVRAVALNAYEMINERYTKDESGTACKITMKEFSGDGGRDEYGISIKFEYSADNGFYTAPAEW